MNENNINTSSSINMGINNGSWTTTATSITIPQKVRIDDVETNAIYYFNDKNDKNMRYSLEIEGDMVYINRQEWDQNKCKWVKDPSYGTEMPLNIFGKMAEITLKEIDKLNQGSGSISWPQETYQPTIPYINECKTTARN